MKYVVFLLGVIVFVSLCVGFYVKNHIDALYGNRIVGLSVLALSFVFMPMFIYYRYRNKKITDYVIKSDKQN